MNRLRILTALMPVVVVLVVSQWCWADSIDLTSSGGGEYDYALTVTSNDVAFNPGQSITLSGLSGVTTANVVSGSSLTGGPFNPSSVTPTTVVFTQTHSVTFGFGPGSTGTLAVHSSVLTLGTIDWSMQTTNGTITGTTQGPVVSAVPEPSTLVLLGTAMLGLVGLARRRLLH